MPPSQRRSKQRCDQNLPSCSNCDRAGVACISTDIDGWVAPRSYLASLEDRVAFLESQLIANGITNYDSPSTEGAVTTTPTQVDMDDCTPLAQSTPIPPELLALANSTLHSNQFSPVHSASEHGSLPSAILSTVQYFQVIDRSPGRGLQALLDEIPYEASTAMPSKDASLRLTDAFFEHCEFFSPILIKSQFMTLLDALYSRNPLNDQNTTEESFRALIVFAIAARLLNRTDTSFPVTRSEAYYNLAQSILSKAPSVILSSKLESLENLLLMVQYACFCADIRAAWYFIGIATRMAIDLGLHDEPGDATSLDSEQLNKRRWLFWATYTFERNFCTVLNRPFSIPDEAIKVPLPVVGTNENNRIFTLQLIKYRRLESEIQPTLHQKPAQNGATLEYRIWRAKIRDRLFDWRTNIPQYEGSTQIAPEEVFDGFLYTTLVHLYSPSTYMPVLDNDELGFLAEMATRCVDQYKTTFLEGKLRFYWRVVHHLYRSGAALVYCAKVVLTQPQYTFISIEELKTAINTCSNVLWGLVERYPAGESYRDMFEDIAAPILQMSKRGEGQEVQSDFLSDVFMAIHDPGFELSL